MFWGGFEPKSSYFVRALESRFDVRVEPVGRDLQFFSYFGRRVPARVLESPAARIWFSGEVGMARHVACDMEFGFWANPMLPGRSFRLPLWAVYLDWWDGSAAHSVDRALAPRQFRPRPHFCNFVYSNPTTFRAEVCHRLDRRRPVDRLGSVLNNAGVRVRDKMKALGDYRFTLAFENAYSPGYVTEKLLEPLLAGSIPIYWGGDEAASDFNPEAFVDARAFGDVDALVAHILALDDDEEAQRRLVEAPLFPDGIPYQFRPEFFADRVEELLSTPSLRNPLRDATLVPGRPLLRSARRRLDRAGRFLRRAVGR
nr:glycosyltransferase family 10 [Prosthecomicrobium pneumaticum]